MYNCSVSRFLSKEKRMEGKRVMKWRIQLNNRSVNTNAQKNILLLPHGGSIGFVLTKLFLWFKCSKKQQQQPPQNTEGESIPLHYGRNKSVLWVPRITLHLPQINSNHSFMRWSCIWGYTLEREHFCRLSKQQRLSQRLAANSGNRALSVNSRHLRGSSGVDATLSPWTVLSAVPDI